MRLFELDLPRSIIEHFVRMGYRELYPPQEEALERGLLKTNRNMVIATPTASGKTFIAVLAIVKNLLEKRGKTIYLVPLRALAREKYKEFRELFSLEIGGKKPYIAVSTGDYDTPGHELSRADIIIATNERMDSLLRHRPRWMDSISLVVADEAHIIGLVDRGPVLESLLTRLIVEYPDIRIILLSATIRNTDDFSRWLGAEIISSRWRPVPLREGILCNHVVVYSDYSERTVPKITGDPILDAAVSCIREGGQVLVFTQTRREAVGKARKYSEFMRSRSVLSKEVLDELRRVSEEIRGASEVTELSELLANIVLYGVAFHHAGLHPSHREIVEREFLSGRIKILTATPTLAAGVNLPSRHVIITYTTRRRLGGYHENISVFEYKQMAGRAGRPQYDPYGEALLYTRYENLVDILIDDYIKSDIEPIESQLLKGENLDMAILGLVSSYRTVGSEAISNFISNTLCYLQYNEVRINRRLSRSIHNLVDGGLVDYDSGKDRFRITPIGERAAHLYILPSTAVYFVKTFQDMDVPVSELVLLYHVARTKDMGLLPVRKRDIDTIIKEVESGFMDDLGWLIENLVDKYLIAGDVDELSAWKTAFTLYDWINEKGENDILKKWGVEPGDLYVLRGNGEWLSYAAGEVARVLGKKEIFMSYRELSLRIKHGVRRELLPLVQLPGVGRRKARILYANGYKSILDLKKASVEELMSIPGIGVKTARKIIETLKRSAS